MAEVRALFKLKGPIAERPMLYMAPVIIVILVMSVYPILWNFQQSFVGKDGSFPSLYQFERLFKAGDFWNAMFNTFVWVAASMALIIVVGFGLSLLFNQKFKGRKLIRSIAIVPWAMPAIAASAVWKWMYNTDYGILSQFAIDLGITKTPVLWLVDPTLSMWSLILVNVWKSAPFMMLICLSGLQTIPTDIYESCAIDGVGPVRRLFKVTIPLLFPVVRSTILLLTIWVLNNFIFIYNITRGGPAKATETMAVFVYRVGVKEYNYSYAAAAAVMLFIISLVFTIAYVIATNKSEVSLQK
jgi:multiple sugar transport system permease protein